MLTRALCKKASHHVHFTYCPGNTLKRPTDRNICHMAALPPRSLKAIKKIKWHNETHTCPAPHQRPVGRKVTIRAPVQTVSFVAIRLHRDWRRAGPPYPHITVTFHPRCPDSLMGPQRRHVSSERRFKMPWVSRCCDKYINCRRLNDVHHLVHSQTGWGVLNVKCNRSLLSMLDQNILKLCILVLLYAADKAD